MLKTKCHLNGREYLLEFDCTTRWKSIYYHGKLHYHPQPIDFSFKVLNHDKFIFVPMKLDRHIIDAIIETVLNAE